MSRRIMLRIFTLLMVCFLHITVIWCTEVEVTSNRTSCYGGNDGSISVGIINASTSITIRLTHATNNKIVQEVNIDTDTTITFSGLSANKYRVFAFIPGSPIEKTIQIEAPEPLKANTIKTIQKPSGEESCDGIIMAMPSGGTPPYKYNWSENTGNAQTAKVEGLCPGIYRCFITDNNNCKRTSATIYLSLEE